MPKFAQKISVVVPTLNEEGNILALANRLHEALSENFEAYEVIFIDDHSTDNTIKVIESVSHKYPVKVFLKKGKRGKAQSLWQGFAQASYELIATIDGDLQYRPEDIPGMVEKLLTGFDLVQSRRRVNHNKNRLRNLASKVFHFAFIQILHGLNFDTQSCLKIFYKKILSEVKTTAATPWTFDLEFLIKVRHAGYKIGSHDIVFEDRAAGTSKVSIIKQSWEIGFNALKLKFMRLTPVAIPSIGGSSMLEAGHAFKGRRYITHSTLSYRISALQTLIAWQKLFIFSVLVLIAGSFIFSPLKTAIAVVAVLSCIYFLDVLFNFFLVSKSLNSPPEIKFNQDELNLIDESQLPVYSILCPLYREAHILPGFLDAIDKLDWPKDKLDVLLLLEQSDSATIAVANTLSLPDYVRVLVVPHSMPKTKPKACNYGLSHAYGEYLVVYDAEDIPEPQQLKKAFLAFNQVSPQVKCLQAKLNYFNPYQNLLTRLFTAEYSLWFDVILPGLQSINGYIPLGGTSNHFRTKDLIGLGGWDPFNVTEDCDLGARLFIAGYKTAVIDSTTLEEANSNYKNWLRQRSRWIKGYMQTYLVHMRHPINFFKKNGIHALIFQLVVGGKIAFMLINPLLWVMTILYFAMRATIGPAIEALYPPVIFYIAVTSLLAGNFMYLYYYMIGCAKRGHWSLIKYVYMAPMYWLMTSIAAVLALYQLIIKPHFWEKTNHGLQLLKNQQTQIDSATPATFGRVYSPKKVFAYLSPSMWSGGTILILAMMTANFLNFLFNAFLGRALSLEQIAVVTLINTLWSLTGLFLSAAGTTVNSKVSFLMGENLPDQALSFRKRILSRGFWTVLIGSVVWLSATPFLSRFFNLPNPWIILLFVPMFTIGFTTSINSAFLQGQIRLTQVAKIVLFESITKLLAATGLVLAGYKQFAFVAIPISVLAVAAYAAWTFRKNAPKEYHPVRPEAFSKVFYFSALLSGLSSTVFMNLDVLLVNHFLVPTLAGEYALLSLIGKMVYYFGSLPNSLIVTFVSRDLGKGKNPEKTFYLLAGLTAVFVSSMAAVLAIFGKFIIPILLGSGTIAILQFVPAYVFAMVMFTIASSFVIYHLARKQYAFPLASLFMSVAMALTIIARHANPAQVVNDIVSSSAFGLSLVLIMHVAAPSLVSILGWLKDFTGIFARADKTLRGQKRILIFNWRDTKHVYAGGAEVYIHEMAKNWVNEGYDVTVFCGTDRKSEREEFVDGVEVIRRGGFYMVYAWAFFYYVFRFRGQYDVIVDCENGIPFFTPLYATEPVFCVMHHIHQEIFRKYLSLPLALVAQFLEKVAMPIIYRNTKFITVSQSTKTQMEEMGLTGSGIEIVHNGVDLRKFKPGKKAVDPTIMYLGRLQTYKSVDVLIKAFRLVLDDVPTAKLVIAGMGEDQDKLKKLSKDLGIDQAVEFTGRVDEQKKVGLMQKTWVFVNPSFIEGWGITTIEANACAVPVIGANVPGLRDSVRNSHTGYLVEYGNVKVFAQRIVSVLENEELRTVLGAQAHEWAKNFDWLKTSNDFLSVINSDLANRNYAFEQEKA